MSLAIEHIADLKACGLTDATISALRFKSLCPADIPVRNAQSAYELPYFNADGTVNCFTRVKLFPAVRNSEGHTQKYWQPAGSQPGLYLPPSFFNWQTVARNPQTTITITEGEKKAAAACQAGLVTAGVGGVWNWTSTISNGERLVLPALDAFQWTSRPVLLCPDSDAWKEGKELNILAGFFALAKELEQRVATVQFVVLPDLHGTKTGLDDWLLIPGNDIEHGWPKLQRLALDDARFNTLTAWWQRWREKQATRDAVQAHDQDAVELAETAGLYVVRSAKHAVSLTFDRLTDQRGSVYAEVTITLGTTVLVEAVDLNLKNDRAQTTLANSLKDYGTGTTSVPWKLLLQKACALVMRQKRLGRPSLILNRHSEVQPLTYAVNPLVFKHKPTILYGDGGLGKSTLALFLAMLVSTGQHIAGMGALKGRALFLDWEDDEAVHTRRLQAIIVGHPSLADAQVDYQECDEPLLRMQHSLIRRIQADRITFVVVDSLLAASGGDASAESVSKMFDAIHQLKTASVLLGHIAKTPMEDQREASVYGSVFNKNRARSTWEIKKQQEIGDDISILGLFNRKSNLSRLHHPIGLQVTQNEAGTDIRYHPFDLSQAPELETALPAAARIRNYLELDGAPHTAIAISQATGIPLPTVTSTLSRGKGRKWQMLGGVGQETTWCVLGSK
jgi:hypothetical protein